MRRCQDAGIQRLPLGQKEPLCQQHLKRSPCYKNGILYAPGKATNAGGVAVSGLEMSQNSARLYWTREEVESRLKVIMQKIHDQCIQYGMNGDDTVDYLKGANIAGFVRVADAMLAEGHV
jgi:glutamate dehydrogenase (NADP+)